MIRLRPAWRQKTSCGASAGKQAARRRRGRGSPADARGGANRPGAAPRRAGRGVPGAPNRSGSRGSHRPGGRLRLGRFTPASGGTVSRSISHVADGSPRSGHSHQGGRRAALVRSGPLEAVYGGDWPRDGLDRHGPEEIADARGEPAWWVWAGGLPDHVKLARNPEKPIRSLLINGCECEPYLTADFRLMRECPSRSSPARRWPSVPPARGT